jgi:hypothetical protein
LDDRTPKHGNNQSPIKISISSEFKEDEGMSDCIGDPIDPDEPKGTFGSSGSIGSPIQSPLESDHYLQ